MEGGTGAWLTAADSLAAQLWLEEMRAVDVCQLVLTVEVYPSVGSSRLTVYSPKMLVLSFEMLCALS